MQWELLLGRLLCLDRRAGGRSGTIQQPGFISCAGPIYSTLPGADLLTEAFRPLYHHYHYPPPTVDDGFFGLFWRYGFPFYIVYLLLHTYSFLYYTDCFSFVGARERESLHVGSLDG